MEYVGVADGQYIAQKHGGHVREMPGPEKVLEKCVKQNKDEIAENSIPDTYENKLYLHIMFCELIYRHLCKNTVLQFSKMEVERF